MLAIVKNTTGNSKPYAKIAKSNQSSLINNYNRPVCASCVLFDYHLKHDIIQLEEGSGYLLKSISMNKQKGVLSHEYSEAHLLEIREYSLRMNKYQSETVKKIEECFDKIISTLKKRKNEIMTDVLEKFATEKDRIQKEEDLWIDKEEMGQKILSMTKSPDDASILLNAKYIMDSLRLLNKEIGFKSSRIYNVLDTSIMINDNLVLSYEELVYFFSKYMTRLEPNILEFKS